MSYCRTSGKLLQNIRWITSEHQMGYCGTSGELLQNIRWVTAEHQVSYCRTSGGLLQNNRLSYCRTFLYLWFHLAELQHTVWPADYFYKLGSTLLTCSILCDLLNIPISLFLSRWPAAYCVTCWTFLYLRFHMADLQHTVWPAEHSYILGSTLLTCSILCDLLNIPIS